MCYDLLPYRALLGPLILALLTLAVTNSWGQTSPPSSGSEEVEPPEQFAKRTQWWREARFGMFIHWGLYAVPADATDLHGHRAIAEWYLSNKRMQVQDYEKFAAQFNPIHFNAKQWVQAAKSAGMKYIVITSKHHDGFCLFDSALTDYCITKATPFKRDPLKELAAECRKQGIRLCLYYSIMDWHHPDYLPRRDWEKETRPAAGADMNRYIAYMKGQLRELVTRYGPLGVLWFDGEWESTWTHAHGKDLYHYVRSLQPDILVNNRVDKGRQGMQGMTISDEFMGDFGTPEQEVPPQGFADGRLWESCMTINDTWGYAKNDTNWKSAETLIRTLCDIAHKGGNFLLNVGPTAEGAFPDAINDRLARIGAWMKVNGAAIHGTTRSPFKRLPFDGRCTAKGRRLYLHIFRWPDEGLRLTGLQTPVKEARALDGGERLTITPVAGGAAGGLQTLYLSRPRRLDPVATVIELRLAGPPVVVEVTPAAKAGADGAFTLKAAEAEIQGETARYEQGGGKDNIGFWTNAADYVTWECDLPQAGRYRVEVDYACPPESAGSTFTVGPEGGATVAGTVKATGSWTAFQQETLGEIELPAGRCQIAVRITAMPHGAAMNLRKVRLAPAR